MESVGFFRSCQPARLDDEPDRLERLARYLTRAPIGGNTVHTHNAGRVEVTTLPHLRDDNAVFATRAASLDSFRLPTDYPGGSSFEVIPGHLLPDFPAKEPECGRFPNAANT